MENKNLLVPESFIKEEKVGYLKSKFAMLNGKLYITNERLILISNKTTVGGGLLGLFLKKKIEQKKYGFNILLSEIASIIQGRHGLQKNVLEINDSNNNNQYRILVKNYSDWETLISKNI